ncbi:MAG: Gfo/Idh/MocA family oxidoreductase [Solobacterium sp.]|nr:Gfo/Idh/MocA family oxidoreductase [Solobacterium sp.]
MLKLALAGPGYISRRFLEGARYLSDVKVVALISRTPERVKAYAEKFDIPEVMTYDAFYQKEEIPAVYVCTPTPSHYAIVKACLSHGKHVLCEKPMCLSLEEEEELFALAEENHVLLMEAYKALFTPAYDLMKELLDQQAIGNVRYATGCFARSGDLTRLPEHFGRDYVYDLSCYPVSFLLSLTGKKVQSAVHTEFEQDGNVLSSSIDMSCSDGCILNARSSFLYTDEMVRIYGETGMISCYQFWRPREVILESEEGREAFPFEYESEFTFETQHFADLIRDGFTESHIASKSLSLTSCKVLTR